ncbi:MAG: GHKL domain-containing protein [Mobilitalea sp.]
MKNSEFIYAILIIIFDFTVMYMLLDIKLKNVKMINKIFSLIIFALSLISSAWVAVKYGRVTFTSYFPLLVQIPMYITYFSVSRYRRTKLFFVFISTFIFSTPVLWSPFIVGAFVNYSIKIMTISSFLSYIIMLVLVKKYIAPLFHYALENLQKNWLLLSSLPILYTILSYLSDGYNLTVVGWQETSYFRILILAIIYAAYLLIFVFFKQIREQFLWKNEQAILTLQMDAMKEHLSDLKNSQTMGEIYRQELTHHLQYVNTCISNSNFEESSNYIMTICSELEEANVVHYCENDSVTMLLSSYVTKAKNSKIDIAVDVVLPASIHVAATDLCVILANGIENAILSCERIIDREKKKIKLFCHIKNDKILIQIINPYEGVIESREGLPISNSDEPGMGILSIVNITEKYQGIYSFVASDNLFILSVIL